MPERIGWTFSVDVTGGPKLKARESADVEAYDKVSVTVPGGEEASPGTATVEVQPADDPLDLRLLAITASRYDAKLTYDVHAGSATGAEDVALDGPQLLSGAGAVGLLRQPPQSLVFSNGLGEGEDVDVTVFVARKALVTT